MPISGLLLTLKPGTALQAETITALAARREIEAGQLYDHWLPVAIDAKDDAQARDLHDWLAALPGVEFVDVVSVHFDDADESAAFAISHDQNLPEAEPCR